MFRFDCNNNPYCDETKEIQNNLKRKPEFPEQFPDDDVSRDELIESKLDIIYDQKNNSQDLLTRTLRSAANENIWANCPFELKGKKRHIARKNIPLACPAFTDEYLRSANHTKDLSLSPWRWFTHRNRIR